MPYTSIDKSKVLESNNKNEIYVLIELKSENDSLLCFASEKFRRMQQKV